MLNTRFRDFFKKFAALSWIYWDCQRESGRSYIRAGSVGSTTTRRVIVCNAGVLFYNRLSFQASIHAPLQEPAWTKPYRDDQKFHKISWETVCPEFWAIDSAPFQECWGAALILDSLYSRKNDLFENGVLSTADFISASACYCECRDKIYFVPIKYGIDVWMLSVPFLAAPGLCCHFSGNVQPFFSRWSLDTSEEHYEYVQVMLSWKPCIARVEPRVWRWYQVLQPANGVDPADEAVRKSRKASAFRGLLVWCVRG